MTTSRKKTPITIPNLWLKENHDLATAIGEAIVYEMQLSASRKHPCSFQIGRQVGTPCAIARDIYDIILRTIEEHTNKPPTH